MSTHHYRFDYLLTHVKLPIFLSLHTLPLTINILFPLQKFNNRLPNLFLDLSILILLSGIFNININDSNSNTVRKTNHSKAKIKSWENEKVTDFQENIDEEKLHSFEQKLSRWQNEIGVTDQAIIDSLLEDLGNIFTGSAKKTFGTFNCKNIAKVCNFSSSMFS
jgi:hypothetical protein